MSVNVCMKLNICIGKLSLAVREVIKSVFVVVINEVFLSSSAELLLLQATTTNWSGGRLLSSQLSIYFNNSRRFFFLYVGCSLPTGLAYYQEKDEPNYSFLLSTCFSSPSFITRQVYACVRRRRYSGSADNKLIPWLEVADFVSSSESFSKSHLPSTKIMILIYRQKCNIRKIYMHILSG